MDSLRHRPNHPSDLSTTHRRGCTTKPDGHRLATSEVEAKLLALLLQEGKKTEAYAHALGLDPKAPDIERIVKQAKDRMLLRLKRLRDEL